MRKRLPLIGCIVLLAIGWCTPAAAQTASATETGLTMRGTLNALLEDLAAAPVADAIGLATSLEVATAPFGTSAGAFVFKLDPSTGLRVRTATTFGPSFAERALTSGEGKVSIGASFTNATFDKIGDLSLSGMELVTTTGGGPRAPKSGLASLVLSSETVVMSGAMGASDKLDIGIAVPMVKIKLDGLSWVENGRGDVTFRATGAAISSGLGDIGVSAKYRLLQFGEGQPDPGGVAVLGTVRLPTGDPANFRGLGLYRTMVSVLASSGRGKIRPHANLGYELWNKSVQVTADLVNGTTVNAKNQVQYAGGLEIEATPKLTLLLDVLGRRIQRGGRVGYTTFDIVNDPDGITGLTAAVARPVGIQKVSFAPGLKWNLKGTILLSLNALVPVYDTGLHDQFTPVIGLDWNF